MGFVASKNVKKIDHVTDLCSCTSLFIAKLRLFYVIWITFCLNLI